ncbi:pentapeptide repeat-containing protein [Maritalea sp.]|uniref:pentapeptide repeat-containing protein n=1 Tax=Maritalea sp. TaxID=2003361 RepID=UPI003EF9C770
MTNYVFLDQSQLDLLLEDQKPLIEVEIDGLEFDPDQLEELVAQRVKFKNCRWIDCDLSGARFSDCQFSGCSFSRSKLGDAAFDHCGFFDSQRGEGTDFSYAEMREAQFSNCNLSSARFVGADLFDISIKDSKANGADFGEATFTRTYGRAQRVTRANLIATIFDDANMPSIDFGDCNLSRSSFCHADLSSCIFLNADMSGCDLTSAQLRRSNFDRADLRGARLEGFMLGELSGYDGIKISEDQQATVLAHLGVQVFP